MSEEIKAMSSRENEHRADKMVVGCKVVRIEGAVVRMAVVFVVGPIDLAVAVDMVPVAVTAVDMKAT
jgi:hypothetical protein